MKTIIKKTLMLFMCVVITLSVVACTSSSPSPSSPSTTEKEQAKPNSGGKSSKDTMNVVIKSEPGSLDPHDNTDEAKHQSLCQVYEPLVKYDETGKLIPWLAESWEYEDDLTLVLHIRKGVKFHNGDELKASDVLFSYKRIKDENLPGLAKISRIDFDKSKVVDDYTVKIVTQKVFATQLAFFESQITAIISERAYKESKGDFYEAPIGTGPYKVVKYNSGDSLILEGFEDYWIEGQPYVKHLTLRYITDPFARAVEAESGGADIVYSISATDVDRIGNNPNINLVSGMASSTTYMALNQAFKPLDDIRVREAIWYALDVPRMVEVAYGNFGKLAKDFVMPKAQGAHPDLSSYFPTRDLERAKALLKDAGYENGFNVSISYNSSDLQRKDLCEVVQAQLADVKINVEIKAMEDIQWSEMLFTGGNEISFWGTTVSTGEAGNALLRYLPEISDWPIYSWESEEYYNLINEALATIDTKKRNELFFKCQEMLMGNYVSLPIWHREINAACQPDVKGFRLTSSSEQHYLQTVYFE